MEDDDLDRSMPALPHREGVPHHVELDLFNRRSTVRASLFTLHRAVIQTANVMFVPQQQGRGAYDDFASDMRSTVASSSLRSGGPRAAARKATKISRPPQLLAKAPRMPEEVQTGDESGTPYIHPAARVPMNRAARANPDESVTAAVEMSSATPTARFVFGRSPSGRSGRGAASLNQTALTMSSKISSSYGAATEDDMRSWARSQRGRVRVEDNGVYGEAADADAVLTKARGKLRRLVVEHYLQFRKVFRRRDPQMAGAIPRRDFDAGIVELRCGLTDVEMLVVLETAPTAGPGLVDYEDFLIWVVDDPLAMKNVVPRPHPRGLFRPLPAADLPALVVFVLAAAAGPHGAWSIQGGACECAPQRPCTYAPHTPENHPQPSSRKYFSPPPPPPRACSID